MLIKNYTTDRTLYIIDDITDVVVHGEPVKYNPVTGGLVFGFQYQTYFHEYFFSDPRTTCEGNIEKDGGTVTLSEAPDYQCRLVDFTKNGENCRLYVTGQAYVCSDEGATIEKVSASV